MILVCGKDKIEVEPSKAQSILYIQKAMRVKGWELPKDSPYEFKDNALIKRADKKDCKPAKKSRSTAGEKSSRKTPISHGDSTE